MKIIESAKTAEEVRKVTAALSVSKACIERSSLVLAQSQFTGFNAASFGSLAQLIGQRTFNPLVAGSNPARPTTNL